MQNQSEYIEMNKERELLMKVCKFLDSNVENDYGLISEIRNLLAQPNEEKLSMVQRLEEYKKGYARAEQRLKREPLSDHYISLIRRDVSFDDLVRGIEKAHGIGLDNET
jgi:hypothetical protein